MVFSSWWIKWSKASYRESAAKGRVQMGTMRERSPGTWELVVSAGLNPLCSSDWAPIIEQSAAIHAATIEHARPSAHHDQELRLGL